MKEKHAKEEKRATPVSMQVGKPLTFAVEETEATI